MRWWTCKLQVPQLPCVTQTSREVVKRERFRHTHEKTWVISCTDGQCRWHLWHPWHLWAPSDHSRSRLWPTPNMTRHAGRTRKSNPEFREVVRWVLSKTSCGSQQAASAFTSAELLVKDLELVRKARACRSKHTTAMTQDAC